VCAFPPIFFTHMAGHITQAHTHAQARRTHARQGGGGVGCLDFAHLVRSPVSSTPIQTRVRLRVRGGGMFPVGFGLIYKAAKIILHRKAYGISLF